jgi:hypothetical protein
MIFFKKLYYFMCIVYMYTNNLYAHNICSHLGILIMIRNI